MNFDKEIINPNKKDETFSRTMGQKLYVPFSKSSDSYGHFTEEEKKYQKTGIKERVFEEFFKTFVNNEQTEKKALEESIKNIRLYDTTNKNLMISQPGDSNLGRRHMTTQDNIPIDNSKLDKLFMASHEMSKFPSLLSEAQVGGYVDKFIPYYKDKEITYWSMNLNKGNMYRSSNLGINPYAKTSGFTQPIHLTKSVHQFDGNVTNSQNSKNIFLNELDEQFSEKYKNATIQKNIPTDFLPEISNKIFEVCVAKGWLGLRKLRVFLRNVTKKSSDVIDKNNFKFFFINFGIVFNEKQVEFIYSKFDVKRKNEINFNEFLDSFVYHTESRMTLIKNFYEQLKTSPEAKFVSLKKLEKLFNPDSHPEVRRKNCDNLKIYKKNF